MADEEININEFFPSIPAIAEEFKKKYFKEHHTKEEWWDLFKKFLEDLPS